MILAIAPPTAATPIAPERARTGTVRRLPWLLAAGWLVQVLLRLWLAQARTAPVANPDESGYLTAARWLAGGPGADLSGHTFYEAGYALLLTPVFWLTDDPETAYRLVVGVNALAGAAVFPLGLLALRRFGLTDRAALGPAFAAATLPAVVFFGMYALADAVLPVVVLAWLLTLDRFVRFGSAYAAAGASLLAVYAYMTHSRGQIVLAVHLVVLGALALRDRDQRRAALAPAVAVAVAGMAGLAATMLNDALLSTFYSGGARDLGAVLQTRMTSLDGQARALSGAAGQIWYMVAASWGLAGIGLLAVAAVAARRNTERHTRIMAIVLLAVTIMIAYGSSAALPDENRVGNYAYGRYLSCVAVVYTLAGLAVLVRGRHAGRYALGTAGVLAVTGGLVVAYAGDRLRTSTFIGFDFPEINFLTGDSHALHLTRATVAALGLLAILLCLARRPVMVGACLLAIDLAAMVWLATPFTPARNAATPPVTGGVAVTTGSPWQHRARLVYPVWWTRIGTYDPRQGPPPRGVCAVVVPRPAGTATEATWPQRPASWIPQVTPEWITWYDPSCRR